jgi:hypothetical protein
VAQNKRWRCHQAVFAARLSSPRPQASGDGMRYRMGQRPLRIQRPHNRESWARVQSVFNIVDVANYDMLATAVLGHCSDLKCDQTLSSHELSRKFIGYCVKEGWLVRV